MSRARLLAVMGSIAAVELVLGGFAAIARSDGGGSRRVIPAAGAPTSTTTAEPYTPVTTTAPDTTTTTASGAAPAPPTSSTARAVSTTTPAPSTTTTTAAPTRVEPKATGFGEPSVPPRPGVVLTLRLDRTTFSAGDTISGTVTVRNGSSADVTIGPNECSGVHGGLYRSGEWVGGPSDVACPAVVAPVVIAPDGSHEFPVRFDARGPTSGDGTQTALAPGVYQAGAGVYFSDRSGSQRQAWFAPSIDVEVR